MVKRKKIFSAFVKGERYLILDIFFACLFFSIMPIVLYIIYEKDSIMLAVFLLIITFPLTRNVFRNYVEFYDDGTYGAYVYLYGLKFGRVLPLPKPDHIYLYRTTIISKLLGNASNRNSNVSTFKNEFVVLQLFDAEDYVMFQIYCSDEKYVNEKSMELSGIFNLEIRDNRGREMEVYRA